MRLAVSLGVLALAVVGLGASILWALTDGDDPVIARPMVPSTVPEALLVDDMAGLLGPGGQDDILAGLRFTDGSGATRTLADFAGEVVVLNLWATWCAPCVVEMPTLDALQAAYDDKGVEVIALSIDRGGIAEVAPFYDRLGLDDLDLYADPSGNAVRPLGIVGLPATLILGPDGREIARLIGPAHWDGPAARAVIDHILGGSAAS